MLYYFELLDLILNYNLSFAEQGKILRIKSKLLWVRYRHPYSRSNYIHKL